MRIGVASPLWKPVPPEKYGGTELIVSYITEELVKRGHEVTLFASGDSKTSARLISPVEKNLHDILGGFDWKEVSYDILEGEMVAKMATQFDIIHNHNGFVPLSHTSLIKTPVVTTLHSSLPPEPKVLAAAYKDRCFISISDAQRKLAPYLNYIGTVYHGIPVERFPFSDKHGDYLLFLGTFSPHKGPDIAIEVARRSRLPIILVGERRKDFEGFIKSEIEGKVSGSDVLLKGELDFEEKTKLLLGAAALLMPVRWDEAFGLAMIEAMACGTPVIGMRRGAVPEIVSHGETGFVVDTIDEMVEAIKDLNGISRERCRRVVEERFSVKRMVDDYEGIYEKAKDSSSCAGY